MEQDIIKVKKLSVIGFIVASAALGLGCGLVGSVVGNGIADDQRAEQMADIKHAASVAWAEAVETRVLFDAAQSGGAIDPVNVMAAIETPCATEDSDNCFWLADTAGNGEGQPFLNIEGHVFPISTLVEG